MSMAVISVKKKMPLEAAMTAIVVARDVARLAPVLGRAAASVEVPVRMRIMSATPLAANAGAAARAKPRDSHKRKAKDRAGRAIR